MILVYMAYSGYLVAACSDDIFTMCRMFSYEIKRDIALRHLLRYVDVVR